MWKYEYTYENIEYLIFEEKTSDLPVDGAVDVVIVSSGLKMLMNKYLYELIFYV